MDPVLTERWLGGSEFRSVVDQASISVVRDDLRGVASSLGFDATAIGELALIGSELATNQLRHAKFGRIAIRAIERDEVGGVEIVALDRGEGIQDPTAALLGEPRASGSLGVGLSSVLRFSDEVDFDVRGREGTCVRARKFVRQVGRRREVGAVGRPIDGEPRSGDDAWFGRRGDRLILAVADGLGHGGDAREAASRALEVVVTTDAAPSELCVRANAATIGTRGTVLTIIEIDERARRLRISGAGNVMTHVIGPRGTRVMSTPSSVLGKPQNQVHFVDEELALDAHDVVVVFTDGISVRARLDVRDEVLHHHPLGIAHHMLRTFARSNDDAMVLVAR
jgi:anti-sigma regulatory factor (Ser/Thr protein kinase)